MAYTYMCAMQPEHKALHTCIPLSNNPQKILLVPNTPYIDLKYLASNINSYDTQMMKKKGLQINTMATDYENLYSPKTNCYDK